MILLGILVYVALQVLFGLWAVRRVRNEEDYLVGGRRIGPTLATFTIFATWFGAETCIGAAAQAYEGGVAATAAEPFGYALSLLLMGVAFAAPLWRRRLVTLADLFRERFGVEAERLSVLLMVPTSILWAAAQIRAFGQILAGASGMSVAAAVALAAFVVVVYTALGGFLADAISDLVQAIVLTVGLLLLAVAWTRSGGVASLLSLPAERLALAARGSSVLDMLELLSLPILGSVFAQELVARVVASRSPQVARRSTLAAAGVYFCVGLIPVALGLAAASGGVDLGHPEQLLVTLAGSYMPTALYLVFVGALVSAILSTVDSALLVAGSLVAHNVVLRIWPGGDERRKVRVNRVAVVAAGVCAYLLTLSDASVWDLVVESSGFGSAGIFVAVVFGLHTRFGGPASALTSLVAGLVVYMWAAYVAAIDYPFVASLAAALLGYLVAAVRSGAASARDVDPTRSGRRPKAR